MNTSSSKKTTNQNKTTLPENLVLTAYEQRIENAIGRREYISSKNLKKDRGLFRQAVENYRSLHQSKPITIRIKQKDLLKVKIKAKKSAIPYQTLLGLLTHQYAEGKIQLQL